MGEYKLLIAEELIESNTQRMKQACRWVFLDGGAAADTCDY